MYFPTIFTPFEHYSIFSEIFIQRKEMTQISRVDNDCQTKEIHFSGRSQAHTGSCLDVQSGRVLLNIDHQKQPKIDQI